MFVHFSAQPPAHAIKWFRIWGADDKNRICSITTDGGSYIKFGQTGGADSTRFWKQARPPANTWTVMEIYVDVPAGGATGFIQNRMANKPINTLTDATRNLTGRGHRFAIMGYDAGSEPEEPKLPVIDIGEIYCADSEARVLVTESSDWTAIGNKQELCELVEWGNGRIKVKLCLGQFADATDKKLILVRHDRSVVFVGTFKTSEAPPIPVPPETGFDPAPGYDVRGDFRPDGVITIKRDRGAFGQGPTVVMFDDHRSGSPGDQAPLMSTIGSWSKYRDGSLGPIIAEGGRTGNCISVWNPDGATNARQLARELVTGQTFSEFYVSYCMRFRDGKNADTPNKYGSNLKSVWFTNGGPGNTPGGAANMDIHCLSWPDVTNSVLSGNNAYQSVYLIPRTFWSKTKWNMIQIWLKPGDPIGDANDYVYARLDTTDAMRERVRDDRRVYKADRPKELKWFGVLGWAGNLDDPHTFDPLMDDIYLAIGPHSAARVMLGNASTWSGCTDFALATPVEWKDGELTVRLRAGPWTDFTGKHLYVVNEDNSPEYAGEITGE
jgi:hypothetical protein